MARTREDVARDLKTLEANYKKEFGGQGIPLGRIVFETFQEMLWERQKKYVTGMFGLYKSTELAFALDILAEKSGETVYVKEETDTPPTEDFDPKAFVKRVVTRKAKGKGK